MSSVREWVERRKSEHEKAPDEGGKWRVTLRISLFAYYKLGQLADELGMSKTGCAEELLERAIADGWETAIGGNVTVDEFARFLEEQTKKPNSK